MDADRFDTIIRRLGVAPTRRALVRGLGLAAPAALLLRAVPVGAAKPDGARCKRNTQCGSGLCKKKGKKKKGRKPKKWCKRNPEAHGCTIEDQCMAPTIPCPEFPDGFCAVTLGGNPFCATSGGCIACTSNADCEATQNQPGARCVLCPGVCEHTNSRSCVWFDPAP